jgi:hypothetical protein
MTQPFARKTYRAGESVEDFCRACKTDRLHTIIVVDSNGQPLRVSCDYCESQHNFRGGPRIDSQPPRPITAAAPAPATNIRSPLSTAEERTTPDMTPSDVSHRDLEMLLRKVLREESGITPVAPAPKWRGGTMVLRPGAPGLQEKSWPIDTFFHKVVMLRNRLRTLEQQVNASELPDDVKIKLQGYISGCYGSLTSFNVLFADTDDQFKGSSGEGG